MSHEDERKTATMSEYHGVRKSRTGQEVPEVPAATPQGSFVGHAGHGVV